MTKSIFSLKTKIYIFIVNTLMLLSVVVFQYKYQVHELENEFHINADIIDKDLSNKIATIKGVVTSVSSYYKSSPEMDSSSFMTLGKDLLSYYNYIDGVGFATIVNHDEKDSFIQGMHDLGFYDFKFKNYNISRNLVESKIDKPRYAPLIYIEPSSYKYTRFYGYDIYNDKLFHDAFVAAAKSDEVAIKDMVKSSLGNMFHFFIKATYNGYIKEDSDDYRFKNTNGFYIINISLDNILLELRKKFSQFNIQVIDINAYEKIQKEKIANDTFKFKKVEYFKKIDGFEKSHLYVCRRLQFSDFNFTTFILIMFLILLIQIIYVYIWHKDILAKEKLKYRATHDFLTDLYSRHHFKEEAAKKIKDTPEKKGAILFIDLDRFKEVNDSFGHIFGDEILIEISKKLNMIIDKDDILGRHGGDEFLVLLSNIQTIQDIEDVVNKIMLSLKTPIFFHSNKIYLTLSIGISIFPDNGTNIDNLLKYADSAMFKAKDEGRNTFRFYNKQMTQEVLKRVTMENKLKEAIKNDDFSVFYQPQYNGISDEITGLEALVRWKDKDGGFIFPNDFIPLAENTGLIIPLDRLVMKQAIKQFSIWKKQGLQVGVLSLNLSTKQLKSDDFIPILKEVVAENGCEPIDIELEITESAIMEDPAAAIKKLEEISSLGFKLSVDDFGTGYSSLAYLKKLPINKLKIDKSFIDGLPKNEEDIAISRSVIALAKSLRLDLIAEGVENEGQKDFLLQNGCNKIQGYFYSKPMKQEDIETLLNKKEENPLFMTNGNKN